VTRVRLVTWDWREQPDWDDVRRAIGDVLETGAPGLALVPDTGSDQYVLAVAGRQLTGAEAQLVYDDTGPACLHEDHDDCARAGCACLCHLPPRRR
jgi:hypothetical protein